MRDRADLAGGARRMQPPRGVARERRRAVDDVVMRARVRPRGARVRGTTWGHARHAHVRRGFLGKRGRISETVLSTVPTCNHSPLRSKRVYSWGVPNEYAIFVRFLALAE